MWLNTDIACVSMCLLIRDATWSILPVSVREQAFPFPLPSQYHTFRFTPSVLKFYACQLPKPYRHIRCGLVCAVSWSTSSTCLAMWLLNAWVSATTCCHASLAPCSSCEVMAATPSPRPTLASTSSSPSVARRCLATQRRRRMGGCTQRSAWKPLMATWLSKWIWLGFFFFFGYTKKMENGWMCLEKCVETINGYLSKWIWLGCMGLLVVMGGGGGVWLHKEDGWWVDVLREVYENHQRLPHWVNGFGWVVCVCVLGGGGG